MAKQNTKSAHEAEQTKSIGEQMKSNTTQRDRNLAIKAEMIKEGTHPKPTVVTGGNRERNLALKAQLKKESGKGKTKAGKGSEED